MKTSNIIILVYLGVILTGLVVIFSISDYDNRNNEKGLSRKSFPLTGFSTLVVEQDADLHLVKSDSNSISIEYLKDKKVPAVMYKIQHDTLFVYGGLRTFVNAKDVETIIGKKHYWLGITGFESGDYQIKLNGGKTKLENDGLKSGVSLNAIIDLKDSAQFDVNYIGFNSLKLHAENSNMEVNWGFIQNLEAELTKNSGLSVPSPDVMKYSQEFGCKIKVY